MLATPVSTAVAILAGTEQYAAASNQPAAAQETSMLLIDNRFDSTLDTLNYLLPYRLAFRKIVSVCESCDKCHIFRKSSLRINAYHSLLCFEGTSF